VYVCFLLCLLSSLLSLISLSLSLSLPFLRALFLVLPDFPSLPFFSLYLRSLTSSVCFLSSTLSLSLSLRLNLTSYLIPIKYLSIFQGFFSFILNQKSFSFFKPVFYHVGNCDIRSYKNYSVLNETRQNE
jgi:hypothetical protein